MSSSPPTASPPNPAPKGTPRQRTQEGGGILARGWVVRIVIVVTLLLTMGMVTLIYVRWLTVQEPTATIIINGDSSLDGAQILLTGGPSGPVPATLNGNNGFFTPIHLQPGQYHLLVKLGDQTVLETDVSVDRLHTNGISLPTLLTITGEPTDDGADASLTSADGSTSRQELDHQSDYSASWRLGGGTYHLTVVHAGITLYENPALVIAPNHPISIDLAQPRHGRD
jgi:hypothetical protein